MKIALALGSNKGHKKQFLFRAIRLLSNKKILSNIVCSTFIESSAMLLEGSPIEWDKDFVNCVVVGDTSLQCQDLFDQIKNIEVILGREDKRRWSPREIDIDILLYGGTCIKTSSLQVPHVEMLNRDFVLFPMKEVAAEWVYPGEGRYKNMSILNIVKDKYGL